MIHKKIIDEMLAKRNDNRVQLQQKFFKTGKGGYGEGDVFLGITMPALRTYCKKYEKEVDFEDVEKLLQNKYHEVRMAGVILLIKLAKNEPKKAFEAYVSNTGVDKGINNWDLIDVSTPHVIGPLVKENKKLLDEWIKFPDLWVNRMAVLATAFEIGKRNPELILEIAPRFLDHKHDLIHKAVGWMLREMGKKCGEKYLVEFLEKYSKKMPRTMLRYSIERLDKSKKERFMGKI